jgi:hypothetical protein
MWIWVQAIAVPHQQAESATRGAPRGNLSDLYPRWLGARELLLHHRDPYTEEITREIQIGYYGRVLDPTRPNDPKDQQAFAYPIYVVLMLAPTVTFSFAAVHKAVFWLFALLTALSVMWWRHTLGWRLSASAKIAWILLTLSCFPSIQGLKLQQLTVLVAALVAASINRISRREFVWAGLLLALATIKPQLVFLTVLWLCIWVSGNWRERRRFVWSFGISMALLIGAGEALLPGWIKEFRTAMASYYRYTGGGNSVLDVVLTPTLGRVTAAFLVAILLAIAWETRRHDESSPEFQYSLSLTLATTLLVIPMFAPYNQVLLVPAFMMFLRSIRQLWNRNRLSRFFVAITALSVFWPFLAGASLVAALAFLPDPTVQKAWGLPFYPSFAIPITIYAMLLASKGVLITDNSRTLFPTHRVLQQNAGSE